MIEKRNDWSAEAAYPAKNRGPGLLCCRVTANNLVPLNDGCNANTGRIISRRWIHTNNLAHGANENFRTTGDFRGQRQGDVKLGTGAKVLVNREVEAASGDVARFAIARGSFLFDRHPNDDRQGKIISTCCS